MGCLLTIFTPALNRAHTLPTLYQSLKAQEIMNFEWVVIDDGSTDDTKILFEEWKKETPFPLTYIKKENEGKHIAINMGVQRAQGDYFFIADSDDWLLPEATRLIQKYGNKINNKEELAGVSFRRGTDAHTLIGSPRFDTIVTDVFDFRFRRKVKGDMAEVFKTAILKEFPFPEVKGEKFCPESLIWHRVGLKYKMLWTSHIIYICHYLKGGLTDKSFEIRKNSPKTTLRYYNELQKMPIPWIYKLKANINYWRFFPFLVGKGKQTEEKNSDFSLNVLGFPLALLMRINDRL